MDSEVFGFCDRCGCEGGLRSIGPKHRIIYWCNDCIETVNKMTPDKKEPGTKHDATKPRWSLLPAGTIAQVVAVLEYGATKYLPDNWMRVADHRTRYYNAAMRHVESWWGGEKDDPESGLPHLAHAVCSILYLMWFDAEEK